ncbi:ATP-binding protein [Xanthomonas campestris pv. campestris]|uniref:ATP-binding protein n=1 Tax=Xanthomonas campestris TaxID=339 RepID=UPI00265BB5B3|nr:ATP-binding protein [Xanthomonas campestris]MDO0787994.1 ATP-binding protein [Xanthomonas campestris pv. campestris]
MNTVQVRNIKVVAQPDFLKSLANNASPIAAVAELIWNGFDAKAQNVSVILEPDSMKGIHAIRISDDGDGIDARQVSDTFGGLGNSWKAKAHRHNGRSLHGKNGRGRFKAFSLGELVEWRTTYFDGQAAKTYTITGRANQLTEFDVTSPTEAERAPGTDVVVNNLRGNFPSLTNDKATQEITRLFAAYLTEYPGLTLYYHGKKIDPTSVQVNKEDFHLGDIALLSGKRVQVAISIIEWSVATERSFELCDSSGVSLHGVAIGAQIKAPGYNFTVYVKSDHFRDLDKGGLLVVQDLSDDVGEILRVVKAKVRDYFHKRFVQHRSGTIQRWKDEKIYPYENDAAANSAEQIERQVFDILAINVEDHLPSFDNAPTTSKKFTFRLLAQAIRDNPDSVRTIMDEVLNLKREEQDELAVLLQKTSLSKIITSAKIVADRLNFVEALSDLLFNKETKKRLLERDQLHKALAAESWIFKEDFNLAGSEKSLENALAIHTGKLGSRSDDKVSAAPVLREGDKGGRIDLMLARAIQPTEGVHEYLVVELKRASKKIDSEVLTQIESYAIAVAQDPRFHQKQTRWTFLAVASDMDDFAKRKARQKLRPDGLVFDSDELNITVWAKTWSEILNDARARLSFFSKQLDYQADFGSEREYLKQAHSKYIPEDLAAAATEDGRHEEE